MTLVETLKPGDVVVDVGANVGGPARQYVSAGAEVWAIEPDARCWPALRTVVGGDRILGFAVGDHDGIVTFYRSTDPAHNSIAEANLLAQKPDLPPLTLPVYTLDSLQAQGLIPPHIDAIKVDAQGAEVTIVRGATRIMQTQAPRWWVEFWPQGLAEARTSVDALCALFETAGYVPVERSWDDVRARCAELTGHRSDDVLLERKAAV